MAHQWTAIAAGSVFGVCALLGGVTLWLRRLTNSRVRAASRWADIAILAWLLITLMLGLSTIPVSIEHANHGDAQVMILLAEWAQSIAYLRPAPELLDSVPTVYKAHILCGMTVFLLFPFTLPK